MIDDKAAQTASRIDLAFTRESPYGTRSEPTYSGALSFMRRSYTKKLDGVDVAVVGVPFDLATTNRPGTRTRQRRSRSACARTTTRAMASPCSTRVGCTSTA